MATLRTPGNSHSWLLWWVADLLQEVTNPEFIAENGKDDAEQMRWLRGKALEWDKHYREYLVFSNCEDCSEEVFCKEHRG